MYKNFIRKQRIAFLLTLLVSISMSAQKKIWYDAQWKKCKEKKAKYYRIITPEDGKFLIKDYYLANDQVQMEGLYTSLKGDNTESSQRTGVFTYYFENGQISSQGKYDGKNEIDSWTTFWKNGKVRRAGKYDKDGKAAGIWQYYYSSGKFHGSGSFARGEREGKWVWYKEEGDTSSIINYSKGKKHGMSKLYYSGNLLHEYYNYDKDSIDGICKEWWPNGRLSDSLIYKDNKKNGKQYYYFQNGKMSCMAEYNKGKFVSGKFYNDNGTEKKKKITKEDMYEKAEYEPGDKAFSSTLYKNFKDANLDLILKEKAAFFGYFKLTVDTLGKITKHEWVIPDVDEDYNDEYKIIRVFEEGIEDLGKFKPAMYANREIESVYYATLYVDYKIVKKYFR